MIEPGLVTIVIPCFNQAHFLGETIESVLKQTYQNFEIIVVNDGSTDNTSQIAKKYSKVRVIEQKNQGLAKSRNNGLAESKGEFVVFLDSDDKLLPNALEIGVKALKNRPDCAFVSGFCEKISETGNFLTTHQPIIDESDYYRALLLTNFIWSPSNVMYRHQIFEEIPAFDSSVSAAADYEIYLRIARQFPIYHHSQIITEYRQHQTSMSKRFDLMLENVLTVLKMQKEFIKGNKQYEDALKLSLASYKYYYLEGICYQIIRSLKTRNWSKAAEQTGFLFKYPYLLPKLLKNLIGDKINRIKN